MEALTTQVKALIPLHKSQEPVFLTWPVEKFENVFKEISDAYSLEYKVKNTVLENVGHCSSENKLLVNIAAWMYQVYANDKINICLEKLLIETGLRINQ